MYSHAKHPKVLTSSVIPVKPEDIKQSPEQARSARISAEFRERTPVVHDYIGETRSLREHILKLSLFPNLYNKETMKSSF
jgi:hypothetical protein